MEQPQTNIALQKPPIYKKRSFWITAISILLVVAILAVLISVIFDAGNPVYDFEGATLYEDAFAYWFACFKYIYQVRYKSLNIKDSAFGWAEIGADGRSYEESFGEMIREEILLRFIAASLFDSGGYRLNDAAYEEIDALLEELDTEAFGEIPFEVLEEKYGVSKKTLKQTALYEQKYKALYNTLFADESIVYSDTYKDTLAEFYKNYYYRYNMIYVEDTAGSEKIAALESRLYPNGSVGVSAVTGVSEETFTQLEAEYTTGTKVTSGDYPNGIYLYAGASYSGKFSAELISAFSDADEVGKVVKVRNADDNASYYVMRYALDDAPYLSEDSKVAACFADLPSYAGQYIYRKLLRDELPKVVSHGVAETYTVVSTASCKDYNIVNLIGN